MSKRVALYLRVSKTDGSQSTDNQRPECEEVARARGAIVEACVYVEQGSAVKKRPAFERMMSDAKRGKFDVLVIWSLDRFGRSTIGNLLDVRSLDAAGVAIVSCRESWLDTGGAADDPMARIQRTMLTSIVSSIAEMERVRLIQRTKAGIETARRKGKKIGRPRKRVDVELGRKLMADGLSQRKAARALGVSLGTFQRSLERTT